MEIKEITRQVTEDKTFYICTYCNKEHTSRYLADRCNKDHKRQECKHESFTYDITYYESSVDLERKCANCGIEHVLELEYYGSQELLETIWKTILEHDNNAERYDRITTESSRDKVNKFNKENDIK